MEMKLAQRVVIGYYKIKLRTIGMVSPRMAAEQAFKIFCTPYTKGVHQKEPLVFHKAHPQTFRFEDLEIKGFHWIPEKPNGQKVLVVHGFSSYGYKFEKYVQPLLATGFEVFIFFQIPDMTITTLHLKIRSEDFFNGFGLCRRLNNQ